MCDGNEPITVEYIYHLSYLFYEITIKRFAIKIISFDNFYFTLFERNLSHSNYRLRENYLER